MNVFINRCQGFYELVLPLRRYNDGVIFAVIYFDPVAHRQGRRAKRAIGFFNFLDVVHINF